MGLSKNSTGINALDSGFVINKRAASDKTIALGGNPNVGKSTVFNELTGLKQHTGNWPGKTVTNAQGYCHYDNNGYILIDLPGSYSLMAHSAEEEIARDFICFGQADAIVIVCDATCLERNLNLVLQTLEITPNVIVCVNLMDEAEKKGIHIDLEVLSQKLGAPVVGTAARSKRGLDELMSAVAAVTENRRQQDSEIIKYPKYIESAISELKRHINSAAQYGVNSRWLALTLLHWDKEAHGFIEEKLGPIILQNEETAAALKKVKDDFKSLCITERQIKDDIVSSLVSAAEKICGDSVFFENAGYRKRDILIDSILTGRRTAFLIMFLALLGVFWLTITASNYPSQILGDFLFWIENKLLAFLIWLKTPKFVCDMLIFGIYRVLAWVVSVMLPPMGSYKINQCSSPFYLQKHYIISTYFLQYLIS